MDSMEPTPSTTPPPAEPTPPPPQTQSQTLPPPPSTSSTPEIPNSSTSQNPNPNPSLNPNQTQQNPPNQNPQPSTAPVQQQQQQQHSTLQPSQTRPQLNRARPPTSYSQFPQHIPSLPSSSSSLSSSATATSIQRGGLAIGVPAHQHRPPSQPAPFSTYGQSSFNPQYGGVGRIPMNVSNPSTTQMKQPGQGIQTTIGNFGSLSGSQIRPAGVTQHGQPVALQPSMRSQPTTNQPIANQKFQSHALMRGPSMGSPSSPSPSAQQVLQTPTQPWMSAATQGKQMHPSYRQQTKPQTLQQRSHIPQQHPHSMSTVPHQQVASSQQQSMSQFHQSQEHYSQQYPVARGPQSMSHQQQAQRGMVPGNQKAPTTVAQAGAVPSGPPNSVGNVDAGESSSHILSKRTIHELVSQIDPSERVDYEVEDVLMEIAEDFIDSITTVGCSLAKHRKSNTLEAKDILLHLERNWHMSLPGFGGDEIKGYKKQLTNDIHKERLAAVKKSMLGVDTVNLRSSAGQAAGNVKGHTAKTPAEAL